MIIYNDLKHSHPKHDGHGEREVGVSDMWSWQTWPLEGFAESRRECFFPSFFLLIILGSFVFPLLFSASFFSLRLCPTSLSCVTDLRYLSRRHSPSSVWWKLLMRAVIICPSLHSASLFFGISQIGFVMCFKLLRGCYVNSR